MENPACRFYFTEDFKHRKEQKIPVSNQTSPYVPITTRGHWSPMPTGGVWSWPPKKMTTGKPWSNRTWHGRTEKNLASQENGSSSWHHGLAGNRGKSGPIMQIMGTLHGCVIGVSKKIQIITNRSSKGLQDLWAVHPRHITTGRCSNDNLCNGDRT